MWCPIMSAPRTHDYQEYGEGILKMGSFCGHGGILPGFNSEIWYLPQKDAIIVINVNRMEPNPSPGRCPCQNHHRNPSPEVRQLVKGTPHRCHKTHVGEAVGEVAALLAALIS
jgi:hypothetical protein